MHLLSVQTYVNKLFINDRYKSMLCIAEERQFCMYIDVLARYLNNDIEIHYTFKISLHGTKALPSN